MIINVRKNRGVTLLELLVAMIVLLIGLFVVFNLFPRAFSIAYKARAREIAYQMAQTKIERLFAQAVVFNTTGYVSTSDIATEFYTTFNGTGSGNSTAADSSTDTIFTIPSTTMSQVNYTDYRKFESTYYGNIAGYSQYYYRPEIANISDPHLLYLDQITRRLTIYVAIPPVIPSSSFSEKNEMDRGNVVVVAAIRTNRKISALTSQAVAIGDTKIYVSSKEDSYKFPIFNISDDGRTTTNMMIGGATVPDLDFTDAYTKSYATSYASSSVVAYGSGAITGRSVYDVSGHYSYPVEIRPSCSSSSDYLYKFMNTKDLTYSPPGAGSSMCVDPANFCAFISDSTNTNMEPIQITGRGYDSTYGYYLVIQNPIQKSTYASGSSLYAWIYLLTNY